MDMQSQIAVIRLHCEHLHTLLAQVIRELATIEQWFATPEPPSFALVAPDLKEVVKQSEFILTETKRLQGFTRSLLPPGPETGAGPTNPDFHTPDAESKVK